MTVTKTFGLAGAGGERRDVGGRLSPASGERRSVQLLPAIAAASAAGADMVAARAGMRGGVGVVPEAAAIGAAVPAGAAAAGDRDDVAVRACVEQGERHGLGNARDHAERESRGKQGAYHVFLPNALASMAGGERDAGAYFGDRLVDHPDRLLAMTALVRLCLAELGAGRLQDRDGFVHVRLRAKRVTDAEAGRDGAAEHEAAG